MITNKNIQVPRLHIALANDLSAHMKLSNTQISKIVQPGVFLYTEFLSILLLLRHQLLMFQVCLEKVRKNHLKKRQKMFQILHLINLIIKISNFTFSQINNKTSSVTDPGLTLRSNEESNYVPRKWRNFIEKNY